MSESEPRFPSEAEAKLENEQEKTEKELELERKLLQIQDDPRLNARQRAARMQQLGVGVSRQAYQMLLRRDLGTQRS